MFTGIVQGIREVVGIERREGFATFEIALGEELAKDLKNGASVAVNGVCLTATRSATRDNQKTAFFDVMQETLRVTNLADLTVGDQANIERAARFGDEIGGHSMSGHVHGLVEVTAVEKTPDNTTIRFHFEPQFQEYLLPKGYVGLNGASLTISATVEEQAFAVHLIPETLAMTTFGTIQPGDRVNLEIDPQTQAIVDTVKRVLANRDKYMISR